MMPRQSLLRLSLWALACAAARPAAAATLSVDCDWRTPALEESHPVQGPVFRIAVRISGAAYLDGYAFDLGYDTAKVAFVGASAGSAGDGAPNILETRGGSAVAFVGRLSSRDSARVTVGNALAGSDSARSPNGDGVLALLDFRVKAPGTARFLPGKVELLDWKQELDTTAAFRGGAVEIQGSVAIRRPAWPALATAKAHFDPLGRRVASLAVPSLRVAAPAWGRLR